jgi:hypothetical protein
MRTGEQPFLQLTNDKEWLRPSKRAGKLRIACSLLLIHYRQVEPSTYLALSSNLEANVSCQRGDCPWPPPLVAIAK